MTSVNNKSMLVDMRKHFYRFASDQVGYNIVRNTKCVHVIFVNAPKYITHSDYCLILGVVVKFSYWHCTSIKRLSLR